MSSGSRRGKRDFDRRDARSEAVDRQLPYDLDAEKGILGAMLLMPETCDEIALIVREADFFDQANRRLYDLMIELHNQGRVLDPLLLIDRLKASGDLESIGGPAYLAELGKAVPRLANAVHYAQIVREKASNRALILAASEILQEAYTDEFQPVDLLNRAEQKIFQILDRQETSSVNSMTKVVHAAMERINARREGEHTHGGVDTGYSEFDHLTGGLRNGELIILAARPSMGKTALALNMAENVAVKYQTTTLVVSLEMSSLELGERMICSHARVNSHHVRNGTLRQEQLMKLIEASERLSEAPLYIDDSPSRTVTEIAAAGRRLKRKGRLGLIVIDYLQLIEPDNPDDSRQEQVARIARRLKGMARELEVPLLVLAQLNRQADGAEEPKLSQLRESGAIEQDADVVMFVHRDDYGVTKDEREEEQGPNSRIIIAKQRNGPIGQVKLHWMRDYTRFENAAWQDQNADLAGFNANNSGNF